jgi:hypothetical protein
MPWDDIAGAVEAAERQQLAVDGLGPGLDQAGEDQPALDSGHRRVQHRVGARALAAALGQRCGPAALLPRMVPLGEADEAEIDLAEGDHRAARRVGR